MPPALATLLVLGAGCALAQGAAGQVLKPLTQYHLESWQTRDGLPTNGIRALAQDADGFLWLGTEAGLVRFDGVEFRTFDRNSSPALKASDVTALFVDNVNRLWIGTDDGAVLRRRDGVFEEFSQVRLSGAISAFYQDQRGVIWVAGGDSVGRVSGNTLVLMRGRVDTVASIYEDATGVLTLGTYGPLGRIEDDTIRLDAERPRGRPGGARDSPTARCGRPCPPACGAPAASVRTGSSRPPTACRHPTSRVLRLDHRGGLWIGTTAGVARLVGDRLVSRTAVRDADFEGMFVTALLEDREGGIWVATRHGGLHKLRDVPFRAITRREGLAHDDVLSVFEDHAANLWVGTDGAGLTQLNGSKTITWTMDEGLPSNVIWTLAETRDGAIWVGTPRGLARILGGRVTSFAGVEGYPPSGIRAILEDHRGNLWIGSSRQGLWRLRGSEVKRFTKENASLSSNSITVLRESPDGALWIGTMDGGLNRLSRGRFTNYSTEQGLRSNDVTAILCQDQHVWVGTTDGSLHLVRNDRVLALPTKGGVSSGHAHQILDDGRGSIWMTGERGITRLERSELLKVANSNVAAATARVYDFRDGFGRWEFQGVSQSSGVRRADGIAGVSERDRRRHRPQRGVRQVDRRAVREGARGARRRPAHPHRRRPRAAGGRQAARGALHRDQPGGAEPGAVPLQAGRRRRRLGRRRPAPRRVLLEPERRPLSLPGHRDEQRRRAEPARRHAVVARRAAVLGDVVVLRPRRRRLPVQRLPAVPLPRPPRPGPRARAARHRRRAHRGAVAGNHRAPPHRGVAAHLARRARGSRRGADHRAARRAGADAEGHGGAAPAGRAAGAGAEAGEHRPPRRRRRARHQQRADGRPQLLGSGRRRPRPVAPAAGAAAADPQGGGARLEPHASPARLRPQADRRAARHQPRRAVAEPRWHAAPPDRRGRRAADRHQPEPVVGQGRPAPDRAGAREPGRQRPRRHAAGRHAAHRDHQRGRRRGVRAPAPDAARPASTCACR